MKPEVVIVGRVVTPLSFIMNKNHKIGKFQSVPLTKLSINNVCGRVISTLALQITGSGVRKLFTFFGDWAVQTSAKRRQNWHEGAAIAGRVTVLNTPDRGHS